VEVVSGEGGDDSKLFASQLFTAYLAYLHRNGLTAELEETGPAKFSFVCEDMRAEPLFQFEAGCHCVQRMPPNDRSGRKHSSYVAVAVTWLQKQNGTMNECDLEESFQRGHGKGGQHQNKTDSAVRLRHRPTGLEVFINGRNQIHNRKIARLCLAGKIAQCLEANKPVNFYGGAGRGDKVRTYNLADHRITDHRTNIKCHTPETVLKEGNFELFH
jgi:peptide chain release factor 1